MTDTSSYEHAIDTYYTAYQRYEGTAGTHQIALSLGETLALAGSEKADAFFKDHKIPDSSEIHVAYQNAATIMQQKNERIAQIAAVKDTGEKALLLYTLFMDKSFSYDPKVATLLVNVVAADALMHPGEARLAAEIEASPDPRLADIKRRISAHLEAPAKAIEATTATTQGPLILPCKLEGQPGRPGIY